MSKSQDIGTRARVAIVGSGPAGLMAAFVVASAGHEVVILERRRGPGRKLLIAGSSGLNITYDAPLEEFAEHYSLSSHSKGIMRGILENFPPSAWIEFIESLGIRTFRGTSRRYFVEGMKGSTLLRAWLSKLAELGCRIEYGRELKNFGPASPSETGRVKLEFTCGDPLVVDAACLCLGGGSYEPPGVIPAWTQIFKAKGLGIRPFESSNVGYQVDWPEGLLAEAEGKPIKNLVLKSSRATRSGDLVITRYGIEGTPVYFTGEVGTVELDLKPALSEAQIAAKLKLSRENLSPIRRVKRFLNLGEGALALLYHLSPKEELSQLNALDSLIRRIKHFPLLLKDKQPLSEAISSSGGGHWDELDSALMLKRHPGVFLAGEMLDWDAPTGGFLIQGCVSQGHLVGLGVNRFIAGRDGAFGSANICYAE